MSNTLIYKDNERINTYYYSPGKILLNIDAEGKPSFKFLQMRYAGSELTGDKGQFSYKTILQFKVNFKKIEPNILKNIENKISPSTKITLLPLPLDLIKCSLVYSTIAENEEKQSVNGFFEDSENETSASSGSTWNERTFSVCLDKESSQLFKKVLESGSSNIALSYQYYTHCDLKVEKSTIQIDASADSTFIIWADEMRKSIESDTAGMVDKLNLIYSDVTAIRFELKKYPELFAQVDINAMRIPPDFAVMEVRCYDFLNATPSELYAKRIEIKATGMNNEIITQTNTFYSYDSTAYVHTIKFPFAVKISLPYQYRIAEIKEDGSRKISEWKRMSDWTKIIDITSNNSKR